MLAAQTPRATSLPGPAGADRRYDAGATRKLGALRGLGRKIDAKDPRLVHEAAALLTSQLFFAPLLAEMRKLPFGREIGHGGRGEEVFGEQLDMRIADAIARNDRGLTAQVAERLRRGPRAAASPPPQQTTWPVELRVRRRPEGVETEAPGPESRNPR
jgi:hypothetical protein